MTQSKGQTVGVTPQPRLPVGASVPAETRIMTHVQDVAAYILRELGDVTSMKLQKLCYYSYGYHLAWEERELFPERFEAWANGPVCPVLYSLHRGRFQLKDGDLPGQPGVLDEGESESVDLVLSAYRELTAHQLSAMTHTEPPWLKARERAGAAELERSSEPLLDEDIFEFFDALTSVGADEPES
jgi:uncharacterized phage-associated protein